MYDSYLETHGYVHNDTMFNQFLEDYLVEGCQSEGTITYLNGKELCSAYEEGNKEDQEKETEEVPWL